MLLERTEETYKLLAVRGKRMLDAIATILLVDEACRVQASCVRSNRLFVCIEGTHNIVEGYMGMLFDSKKNFDAIVIRHPFKMSLHLLRRLKPSAHVPHRTTTILKYSSI